MAEYEYTAPDGRTFTVTAPDTASEAEVMEYAKANLPAAPEAPKAEPPSMAGVAGQAAVKGLASIPDSVINSIVHAYNLGKMGVGVAAGAAGRPDIPANMELAEPPSPVRTGLEKAGVISESREPQTSAQRIVDTAIQAAVNMAVVPAAGAGQAARNVAVGAASGAASETTRELTGSNLLALAVGVLTPAAIGAVGTLAASKSKPIQQPLKATLQEAQDAGYVVQPSTVRSKAVMDKVESVGGKAAVGQEAAIRNQAVTNQLSARAIGLPDDTPLTKSVLDELKKQAAKPYEEVEALRASTTDLPWFPRYHSKSLLDELIQARQDSVSLWKSYWAKPDDGVKKAAEAAGALAKSLEDDIDMIAKAAGKPELLDQLKAARQLYARINDVEKALNVATGNVSASIIGRAFDKGKPLSGELGTIGRFANAFPRMAKDAETVMPPGVSALEAGTALALGVGGVAATEGPSGALLATAPLLRGPARSLALSKGVQKGLLKEPKAPPTPTQTAGRSALAGRTVAENEPGEQ